MSFLSVLKGYVSSNATSPLLVSKFNIENYKQNKPSYIARDMERLYGVPFKDTMRILLARGVFKWLSNRRKLIGLKNVWKDRVNDCLRNIKVAKAEKNREALKYFQGRLKAYEECRKEVRSLCHASRWQAPDHDHKAIEMVR